MKITQEIIKEVLPLLMSVEEAAAELNKSVAWVRAKAARIGCYKLGRGTWVITPADLEKMNSPQALRSGDKGIEK